MKEWIYDGARWCIAGGCLEGWSEEAGEWLLSREVAPLVNRCLALEAEVERLESGERERQIALLAEIEREARAAEGEVMLSQDQKAELNASLNTLLSAAPGRMTLAGRTQLRRDLFALVSSWLDQAVAAERERCAGKAEGKADFWRSRYKTDMAEALNFYAAELRAGK